VSPLGSGAHPAPYPMGTGVLSPGEKWPGRGADHLPPSSAEVKNGGTMPPLADTWCLIKNTEHFIFQQYGDSLNYAIGAVK
jgi:hypothetical protein